MKLENIKENFFAVSLHELTRMILVRHGQTDDSVEGRMSSRSRDISINKVGVTQVSLLGDRLRSANISKIYSSPQKRALQTAEILRNKLKVEVELDKRLMEYDFGVISDLTIGEVERKYPDLYNQIKNWINSLADKDNQRVLIPGAEPFIQLISRINSFTKHVVLNHCGEKIVVVTHGGFIKALMTQYAGGNIAVQHGRFMASTSSMSVVDFYKGMPSIQSFNDTGHLGFEEVRFGRPLVL